MPAKTQPSHTSRSRSRSRTTSLDRQPLLNDPLSDVRRSPRRRTQHNKPPTPSASTDTTDPHKEENEGPHNLYAPAKLPPVHLVHPHRYHECLGDPGTYEKAKKLGRKHMDTPVTFYDMPPWFQDNIYILRGYRKLQHSYVGAFRSLFYLHNETWNVYTHLIGTVLFSFILYVTYNHLIPMISTATDRDYVVFLVFIAGSFVPYVYYGFYCDPKLQRFYITLLTVLGSLTIFITSSARFSTPKYRYLRTSLFVTLGLCGVIPSAHTSIIYGWDYFTKGMSSFYIILGGVFYLVGALFYAARMPERWFPGVFDLSLQSHSIFHILVVVAALTHFKGVMEAYSFWHAVDDKCEIPAGELMGYLKGM
ncbi:hypothetical protein HDV05_002725 [Chytridiales sp. JEL 0842]|nr:hypothetical protein HDV05_002725 [Chytridiales sp. JEL 0842]